MSTTPCLLLPGGHRTKPPSAFHVCLLAKVPPGPPDAPSTIREMPSYPPQSCSCYFQLSDLSEPPKERVIANLAFTPPSSSDCNSWLWQEGGLDCKIRKELGQFSGRFLAQSSCVFTAATGLHPSWRLQDETQTNSPLSTSPAPGMVAVLICYAQRLPCWVGASIWPPL
jgi:hypothetical protein